MTIQKKKLFFKKLTYTYALLIGTSFLLSSAQAGRYDDVDVIPLNNASHCTECVPCPVDQNIGDCGENFVFNLLKNKGFKTYIAPYNGSGHGIDIVAFKKMNFGGQKIPMILLHESKMSSNANITKGEFKSRLGSSNSGRQQSRTWLNNAIIKMKDSRYDNISQLGYRIENALNNGAYFVRTGNLRVDNHQDSYIQFYALTDKNSEYYALDGQSIFSKGPFLKERHDSFYTSSNELPLNKGNIAYLNSLFQ